MKKLLVSLAAVTCLISSFYLLADVATARSPINMDKLDQDMQLTALNYTFTAFKNWFVGLQKDVVFIQDPDKELTIAFTQNDEADAQKAVLAAWQKVQPGFDRAIFHTTKLPPANLDEIVRIVYNIPAKEHTCAMAIAARKNTTWYVELISGLVGALDKRSAQVTTIISSLDIPSIKNEPINTIAKKFTQERLQAFTEFFEKARKELNIPGAAVGIIQDGKIIFQQGFGVKELGKKDPVTPTTLFMIGSITKPLTTCMMAKLVDQELFDWETPVQRVMPSFILGDQAVTQKLLMKHMVSANTGMPRQDTELFFNYDVATPESRLKEMRTMKPTTGLGEAFQYSNAMVAAGGYIAAHALNPKMCLGDAYDTAMQKYVFDAIGMPSTTFDFAKVQQADHAMPHGANIQCNYIALNPSYERFLVSVRPAAGAWSTIHDIARYMITELNNGVNPEGNRVISEKNLLIRREPQINVTAQASYGLALLTEYHQGINLIGHDGNTTGFTSLMFFMPKQQLGLVVFANAQLVNHFTEIIKKRFLELAFDIQEQAQESVNFALQEKNDFIKKYLEQINLTPDAQELKKFTGTYVCPQLGAITLYMQENDFILNAHVWKSRLAQTINKKRTPRLITTDAPAANIFLLPQEKDGKMQLILEMPQQKYIFTRTSTATPCS